MGHMNIVVFLIQHGSNPNNTTMRGETALHLAARANQTDIIRILLRNGAQVDHAKARVNLSSLDSAIPGLCYIWMSLVIVFKVFNHQLTN